VAAVTRTRTSPGPGSGTGRSDTSRTSGPPKRENVTARMVDLPAHGTSFARHGGSARAGLGARKHAPERRQQRAEVVGAGVPHAVDEERRRAVDAGADAAHEIL